MVICCAAVRMGSFCDRFLHSLKVCPGILHHKHFLSLISRSLSAGVRVLLIVSQSRFLVFPVAGVASRVVTGVESGFPFLIPIIVLLLLRGRQGSVFSSTTVCRSTRVST